MEDQTSIGQKITAIERQMTHIDPVQKNPSIYKTRSLTDVISLFIFGFLLCAWFCVNCTYLIKGNFNGFCLLDENIKKLLENQATIYMLPEFYQHHGIGVILWIAISGTIGFLFFLGSVYFLPNSWTKVGLYFAVGAVSFLTSQTFFSLISNRNNPNAIFIFLKLSLYLIQILFLVGALKGIKNKDVLEISVIVTKVTRAIFFFPTMFLFGLIILILTLAVIAFTVASLCAINSIAIAIFNVIGGIYLYSVIVRFADMVISQSISTWYWSSEPDELPNFIILKSIGIVLRYHFGSILFCATFILPTILSIYVLCKNQFQAPPNFGFKAFFVKLYLVFDITNYALIVTASHGLNVHEATKRIFSLFIRSCAKVLLFKVIFEGILALLFLISALISVGVLIAYFHFNTLYIENESKIGPTIQAIWDAGSILYLSILVIAYISSKAVLVNVTEEIEDHEKYGVPEVVPEENPV